MAAEDGLALSVRAFTFLADEPARMERFLALTGLDPGDLRQQAGNPAFLCGVLDYLLQDETLLLTFCAEAHLDPASIAVARRIIDSSPAPHD